MLLTSEGLVSQAINYQGFAFKEENYPNNGKYTRVSWKSKLQ